MPYFENHRVQTMGNNVASDDNGDGDGDNLPKQPDLSKCTCLNQNFIVF
jgi:hypothetical protein